MAEPITGLLGGLPGAAMLALLAAGWGDGPAREPSAVVRAAQGGALADRACAALARQMPGMEARCTALQPAAHGGWVVHMAFAPGPAAPQDARDDDVIALVLPRGHGVAAQMIAPGCDATCWDGLGPERREMRVKAAGG